MSLTSYRAAPPRDKLNATGWAARAQYVAIGKPNGKGDLSFFCHGAPPSISHSHPMSAEPELNPHQPLGPSLIAIARAMLAQAAHETQAEADAIVVHGVRTAMKRWRAYLRLLEPFLDADALRLRIEARDLARGLAGARDAQSALDALADLGEDYAPFSEKSLATVNERINAMRTSAETATLTDGTRERLAKTFALTLDNVDRWSLDHVKFADLAESLTAGYRRAQEAVPADWTSAETEALHALRQRVIIHRYQMELVTPLWPRLARVWTQEAQRLRDRLGRHHDLAMLANLAAPHQPLARWRSRLAPAIASRQADHIEAAMRQAGRLFAERPKAFCRRMEALWAASGA
jgi:CHAD domain-containing protein